MRMYVNIPGLPAQIYDMLPYVATIVVLDCDKYESESREHAAAKELRAQLLPRGALSKCGI